MHILARPYQDPILAAGQAPGVVELRLRQRLAPELWPISLESLPQGTALVGGAVRDALLGRLSERPDLDLVVPDQAIPLVRHLARRYKGTCVVLDRNRDIARLVLNGWTIDIACCMGPDLERDLQRRDFSANAIAMPLQPGAALRDPTGGLEALRHGQLVAISEANLLNDPLRLLRGVRLAWELDLELETTSLRWIKRHACRLSDVAGERVLAELERLAHARDGEQGLAQVLELQLLVGWGADTQTALELNHLRAEAAQHLGLTPAETAAALPLARLAAVLPPEAVKRLRGSRRLFQCGSLLRRWWILLAQHNFVCLDQLQETDRLQLQRDLEADLPALLLALPPVSARSALSRWRNPRDPLFHPRPPLNGDQLCQELGLAGGPALGSLLGHLTRERAFGRIRNASDAMDCARRWLTTRHV